RIRIGDNSLGSGIDQYAGDLAEEVVDIAASAHLRHDSEVADDVPGRVSRRDRQASQLALGCVCEPPPVPVAWHGEIDVHLLTNLCVAPAHLDATPGGHIETAHRDLRDHCDACLISSFC